MNRARWTVGDAWWQVRFLELRTIVSDMKNRKKKKKKKEKKTTTLPKLSVEISSCGLQSSSLCTRCGKNRRDVLVRRKNWRLVSKNLKQHRQQRCLRILVHTKKSLEKSRSLFHGNVYRYLHWHRCHDDKLVEDERQAAYEQWLCSVISDHGAAQNKNKKLSDGNFWEKNLRVSASKHGRSG